MTMYEHMLRQDVIFRVSSQIHAPARDVISQPHRRRQALPELAVQLQKAIALRLWVVLRRLVA